MVTLQNQHLSAQDHRQDQRNWHGSGELLDISFLFLHCCTALVVTFEQMIAPVLSIYTLQLLVMCKRKKTSSNNKILLMSSGISITHSNCSIYIYLQRKQYSSKTNTSFSQLSGLNSSLKSLLPSLHVDPDIEANVHQIVYACRECTGGKK